MLSQAKYFFQELWYTRKGKKFPASKIDRRFSYGNIAKHLANNKPLHPKSNFMYLDGTIRPISKLLGVRLSAQQQQDYVSGKAIRLDGCSGDYPTLYVKFDGAAMKPGTYLNNPDSPEQTVSLHSFSVGQSAQASSSPQEEQGFAHGGGLTWPEFKALHPELSPQEALKRFRAMKRAQKSNAMGGMHM